MKNNSLSNLYGQNNLPFWFMVSPDFAPLVKGLRQTLSKKRTDLNCSRALNIKLCHWWLSTNLILQFSMQLHATYISRYPSNKLWLWVAAVFLFRLTKTKMYLCWNFQIWSISSTLLIIAFMYWIKYNMRTYNLRA